MSKLGELGLCSEVAATLERLADIPSNPSLALLRSSPFALLKIWIKPNGEMPFLYGNHIVKAHLGKITEDTPEHQGVVVYSMADVPLGFGVTARSTIDTRKLDPTSIIVFNQALVISLFILSRATADPSNPRTATSESTCVTR